MPHHSAPHRIASHRLSAAQHPVIHTVQSEELFVSLRLPAVRTHAAALSALPLLCLSSSTFVALSDSISAFEIKHSSRTASMLDDMAQRDMLGDLC